LPPQVERDRFHGIDHEIQRFGAGEAFDTGVAKGLFVIATRGG